MITTLSLLSVSSHNYTVQPNLFSGISSWAAFSEKGIDSYGMVSYWKWNNGTGAQSQWWCQRGYIILFGCISLYIYDKSILNCCLGVRKSDWVKLLPSPSFNHHLYYNRMQFYGLDSWVCEVVHQRVYALSQRIYALCLNILGSCVPTNWGEVNPKHRCNVSNGMNIIITCTICAYDCNHIIEKNSILFWRSYKSLASTHAPIHSHRHTPTHILCEAMATRIMTFSLPRCQKLARYLKIRSSMIYFTVKSRHKNPCL